MNISRINELEYSQAYGILYSPAPKLGDRDGIYSAFCKIVPGQSTIPHSHIESEYFYIIHGNGLITINNEIEQVNAGDLIRIPLASTHELKNIGDDELLFLSFYSEDYINPFLANEILITTAPPTPNGPLHLGHIGGPYLAADILARYLRLREINVCVHSGTDDHQNYVYKRANDSQLITELFRRQMRTKIQKGFSHLTIEFDEFIEPKTNKVYQQRCLDFMQRAINSRVIEKELIKIPYCEQCDQVLVDAYLNGICPYCNSETHGACEQCGIVFPPQDIQQASCASCNTATTVQLVSVYTFALNKYLPLIKQELQHLSVDSHIKNLIEEVSKLKDLKILLTYPDKNKYGIKVPEMDQVMHVWFEMAAHYEQFALSKQFWIHCFGFDNNFYYLLFIPALLKAMNPQAKLPEVVITNQFFQLEGSKFSTSRGHALWAEEFTGSIDHLRLYLCQHRPSVHPSNFVMNTFLEFSIDLELQLEQLNQRANCIANHTQAYSNFQKIMECNRAIRDMELFLSPTQFDLRRASRLILSFIDLTKQTQDSPSVEKMMLLTLAMLMSPIMPKECERLLSSLKEKSLTWIQDWGIVNAK